MTNEKFKNTIRKLDINELNKLVQQKKKDILINSEPAKKKSAERGQEAFSMKKTKKELAILYTFIHEKQWGFLRQ